MVHTVGKFANFQKLISPKQIMKFLRIFIDDAQKDVAKHFLKTRRVNTNPWEQAFKLAAFSTLFKSSRGLLLKYTTALYICSNNKQVYVKNKINDKKLLVS